MTETVGFDDPLAELQAASRRDAAEETAAKILEEARTKLLMSREGASVFVATLALTDLHYKCDWDTQTCATDGETIVYNPDSLGGLTKPQVRGVLAHEIFHVALLHPTRLGDRDPKLWNVACDLAINDLLRDANFALPPGALFPEEGAYSHCPKGESAEEYYSRLRQPQDQPQDQPQPGPSGPGCGEVQAPANPSPAKAKEIEAKTQVAVARAAANAKSRGELPAGLGRLVEQALAPRVDWREVLREFVSRHSNNDYQFLPPNKKFLHLGIYLPSLRSEELGEVLLMVDTSGSIGQEMLDLFAAEVNSILETYQCHTTILYHDDEVAHVQHWSSEDGPLVLEPKGGGGTSHVPCFQWIEEQGAQPGCIVCLTDLYTSFPPSCPYPVLWAQVGKADIQPPFGQIVRVTHE